MNSNSIEKNKENDVKHWFRIKLDREKMQPLADTSSYKAGQRSKLSHSCAFAGNQRGSIANNAI